jgi:hypothetical protein
MLRSIQQHQNTPSPFLVIKSNTMEHLILPSGDVVNNFLGKCYGRIIRVLFVKIIYARRRVRGRWKGVPGMSHLRSLRREDLRRQRRDFIVPFAAIASGSMP